jgi:hypothetical protein
MNILLKLEYGRLNIEIVKKLRDRFPYIKGHIVDIDAINEHHFSSTVFSEDMFKYSARNDFLKSYLYDKDGTIFVYTRIYPSFLPYYCEKIYRYNYDCITLLEQLR